MSIPERQAELDVFYRQYLADKPDSKPNNNTGHRGNGGGAAGGSKLTDNAVLERLYGEEQGSKWQGTYHGNYENYYASRSEAVAGILHKLAFWTNNDPMQMERLIRGSGLAYKKFDSPRSGTTWLLKEINKAIEATADPYQPDAGGSIHFEGTSKANASDGKRAKRKRKADEEPTHDELRDRWIGANPDYAHGLGEWRKYERGVWSPVKTPAVKHSMVRVLEDAKVEGIRPNVFILNSVCSLAEFKRYIPDEQWDAHDDVIVCEDVAIETRTGEGVPHRREHYATSRVPCSFDPTACAPNWQRFMQSIEDRTPGVAGFLQEFAGYSLTFDTALEKALWLVGPPGGGKSTFLEGLMTVLGSRAGTLGLREIERSQFAVAKMVGKSLVTAAEQPVGFVGCHDVINAIISGEPIQVERKYRDPYDYTPRAKIAWAMNELPRVPSGAEGLFRRIEVVRLPAIDKEERDPTLKEGIKTEGTGILNWMLEGLMRLRDRGDFDVPEAVKDETEEFRTNNDIPAAFVEEMCNVGAHFEVKSSDLYEEYSEWCLNNGHKAKASNTISEDWRRLGFERKKKKSGIFWFGVDRKTHYAFR